MPESDLITFDTQDNQLSYIKVIGVGGGGNNAVNHMYRKGIKGVDFIVSNTDMKALNGSPVPTKLVLGHEGLGVGGRPAKARKAAEERETEIKELFQHNTKMVFITAGMGGGTGTGAAPVIARMAKEIKLEAEDSDDPSQILVVAVVTTPFMFEGVRRLQQAQEGVEELRKYVDSILVINNERLRSYGNLVMSEAFSMANDVLLTAVKGIAEIITLNAYVNIDFRDVYTVMEHSGTALMGIGEGEGENRARQAVEEATTSVLLNDNDISGAKHVLLYFSYGPDNEITMDEMGEVTDYVSSKTGGIDTNVIFGMGYDETLGDKVKITLIATGFEQSEASDPIVHVLEERPEKEQPVSQGAPGEPVLVRREQEEPATPRDIYVKPVIETVTTPGLQEKVQRESKAPVSTEPATTQEPRRNVIPLYGPEDEADQPKTQVQPKVDDEIFVVKRNAMAETSEQKHNDAQGITDDTAVRAKRIECVEPNPLQQREGVRTGVGSRLDLMAMDRAERIKTINNLLRNDVNGAQIVEAMGLAELNNMGLDTGRQAAESNSYSVKDQTAGSSVAANGDVRQNASLYDLPD